MDPAKITFLEESRELLQDMEDALLQLENSPLDDDLINALFRAAHTIKGTAGIFGFDDVEAFTHIVENLLENIRAGKLGVSGDLIALLLKCRDHIGLIVEKAVSGEALSSDIRQTGDAYLADLKVFLGEDVSSMPVVALEKVVVEEAEPVVIEPALWAVEVKFGVDVLRSGMDPLSFIRYLERLGEVRSLNVDYSRIPDLSDINPEENYINLSLELFAAISEPSEIESVFEFVKDDCELSIFPPLNRMWNYISAIDALPDDVHKLGEMLQHSGVLSQDELASVLSEQQNIQDSNPSEPQPKLGELLVDKGMVSSAIVDAALGKQEKIREKQVTVARQLRVDADKLDQLINLVGELVIAGAATNLMAQNVKDDNLLESISSMSHLVEEIRDSALRLRMVHIGETFNRFQRVVRDVSRELGKEIELKITGGDTELDKTMVEKIGDPLMHLVRNAMDHGIESAQERRQKDKQEKGCLQLNAYHDSGSISIEVIDNGRGLDPDKILEKAISKGIVDQNSNLSTSDIYRLVFEPGFSTAEQVTNLSGRGVGMDVVKKNIEALRGTVDIDSVRGEGTTITIRLPLTLAIIDGFLVEVAHSSYVIPLDMVVECIELGDEEQNMSVHNNYINLRGKVLPFLRLSELFGVDPSQGGRENIVVVQSAGQTAGLVVDALLGEFQTVIKPLGKLFKDLKGISGSTILGSGEVAMILDVVGLVNLASEFSAANGHISVDAAHSVRGGPLLH